MQNCSLVRVWSMEIEGWRWREKEEEMAERTTGQWSQMEGRRAIVELLNFHVDPESFRFLIFQRNQTENCLIALNFQSGI